MKRMLIAAGFAVAMALAAPAAAQESNYTPGGYMTVSGIHVEDGQFENYMDYLADRYRRTLEYQRSQGWVTGYRIWANVNAREDEPDLFLTVEMPRMSTPQEQVEREQAVNRAMRETTRAAEQGSGQRVRMRRLGSNVLLQELVLRRN